MGHFSRDCRIDKPKRSIKTVNESKTILSDGAQLLTKITEMPKSARHPIRSGNIPKTSILDVVIDSWAAVHVVCNQELMKFVERIPPLPVSLDVRTTATACY